MPRNSLNWLVCKVSYAAISGLFQDKQTVENILMQFKYIYNQSNRMSFKKYVFLKIVDRYSNFIYMHRLKGKLRFYVEKLKKDEKKCKVRTLEMRPKKWKFSYCFKKWMKTKSDFVMRCWIDVIWQDRNLFLDFLQFKKDYMLLRSSDKNRISEASFFMHGFRK